MRIFGSLATLELDGFSQNMAITKRGDRLRLQGFGSNADLHACLDLVDSTLREREPRSRGEDGLAALEIALAAYESIASGKAVTPGQSPG